jgi:HEPN domain-containing protein
LDDVLRRFKEAQKIQEELKTLEREYTYGRIPKERYEELKRKYEEELKKLF